MSAHTPGPWLLWDYPDPQQAIMGGGGFVAQTVGGNDEANARLIAAAPTMYSYIEQRASNGDIEAAEIMQSVRS